MCGNEKQSEQGTVCSLGLPVTAPRAVEAFASRWSLRYSKNRIQDAREWIMEVASKPAFAYVCEDGLEHFLVSAERMLLECEPYTQCPFYPACEQGECKACNGRCWLNKARYDLVPEPIRRRHEGRRDEQ